MKKLELVFILLVVAAALQSLYYYPLVPDLMASHFDGRGQPNGWAAKGGFFAIYAGVVAMSMVIFWLLPKKMNRSLGKWMNLPNRDYWCEPERMQQTRSAITTYFLVFGIANMLLAIVAIQSVLQANLAERIVLGSIVLPVLVAYFAFVALWVVMFFIRFRKPRSLS